MVYLFIQKSPLGVFYKKAVFNNFAKFTGKHLCWNFFLINLQAFRLATLLKKKLQRRYFPVNFAKLLKNIYFEEYLKMARLFVTQRIFPVTLIKEI